MDKQQLTVLYYYNKKVDSNHLSLYLSQKLQGKPLPFHNWLSKLPSPVGLKQDCLDQLYYYCNEHKLTKIGAICNTFQGYSPDFEKERIKEQLHDNLTLIGIEL